MSTILDQKWAFLSFFTNNSIFSTVFFRKCMLILMVYRTWIVTQIRAYRTLKIWTWLINWWLNLDPKMAPFGIIQTWLNTCDWFFLWMLVDVNVIQITYNCIDCNVCNSQNLGFKLINSGPNLDPKIWPFSAFLRIILYFRLFFL